MKRALFTILFFMTFILGNATLMQRVYHKDYGVIDRTVLVFNKALDFRVDHHENMVEIFLPNCSRDEARVSNELFTSSNVLKSYTYRQDGNNLVMMIQVNDDYSTINDSEFSVEYLSFQQDVYKVALDIFATQSPISNEELLSYVNFYTTMDQKQKAKIYKEKLTQKIEKDKQDAADLASHKNETTPQGKTEKPVQDTSVTQSIAKTNAPKNNKLYLIPIMIIILVGLLIWLIIHILRQGKNVENTPQKDIIPVGREEFRTRVIRKLLDHDWNKRVISLELKVPISEVEEVEKKYQLERANQLDNNETSPEIELPKDYQSSPYFSKQTESVDPVEEEEIIPESEEKIDEFEITEKLDDENAEEQEKFADALIPGEVIRESDEVDEAEVDESLKEMLEYDSSNIPKDEMSQILEDVKFNTDDIEEICNNPNHSPDEVKDDSDNTIEEVPQQDFDKHESEMSKMLRKRFPKTSDEANTDELNSDDNISSEIVDDAEDLPKDPDELLEKAITNKLDELTKKSTPPVE